jgi:cysteine-rich repeat protein
MRFEESSTDGTKPVDELGEAIYGGTTGSPANPVPLVAIFNERTTGSGTFEQELVCTGTLLDNLHVLTAAHCVTAEVGSETSPQEDLRVLVANQNIGGTINGLLIDAIFRHPGYRNGQPGTDVAILRLHDTQNRAGINLPDAGLPATIPQNTTVKALGYGMPFVGSTQTVDLKYFGQGNACKAFDDGYPTGDPRLGALDGIAATELCVGKAAGDTVQKGTCFGDSGGPIVYNDGTKNIQIGITSHGAPANPCGDEVPDVFTSVADNLAFINGVLGAGIRADLNGDGTDETSAFVSEGSPNYQLNLVFDSGSEPQGVDKLLRIDTGIPILHGKSQAPDYLNSVSVINDDGDSKDDLRVEVGGLRADYRGADLTTDTTYYLGNGPAGYSALPSAYGEDGRLLTLATRGLATVDRSYARFYVVSKFPSVLVGFYDPDISGYYDKIDSTVKTCARAYADPQVNGPDDDVGAGGTKRAPAGVREFSTGDGDSDWRHIDGDPNTSGIQALNDPYAFNGTTYGYRIEFFLAPVTTGDGHNACDDPPETQVLPEGMFNAFKIHASGELRVSDVDLSFLAIDSTGDYRGNHSVTDVQWKDTAYQGFFNFPFWIGANSNIAKFTNADADDQDHPSPASAIGKNHQIHSRVYAFRERAHSFFPASEYPSETAKGRPSGGYNPTGGFENGDKEELSQSVNPTGDLPANADVPVHETGYGDWLWQDVHDSNNIHIWIVRGSPLQYDYAYGGHSPTSAARAASSWTAASAVPYLPITLGFGGTAVSVTTQAEAATVLAQGGSLAQELKRQLLGLKLNVSRTRTGKEILDSGFLYGTTRRVRDIIATADSLVNQGAAASSATLTKAIGELDVANKGQVTYTALPTDDVGAGDPDGDGVIANLDNCPLAPNPAQTDTDGNGIGDDCEPTPIVRCVIPQGGGTYRAYFDYQNKHSDRRIAVGYNNYFEPGPTDRGQPRVQYAGGEKEVVSAAFTGTLTWHLGGHSATASASSPVCPISAFFGTTFAPNVVAYGATEVHLSDRVLVPSSNTVAVGGTGVLEVGASSNVGNLLGKGNIFLRNNAKAYGTVIAGWDFDPQQGAQALQGFREFTNAAVPALSWPTPAWPASTGDLKLNLNQQATIGPSSLGEVSAPNGAVLRLTAGTYYFDKLRLQNGSRLVIDDSNGPVVINLLTELTIRGVVQQSAAPAQHVAIVYYGTAAAFIETSLRAAVAALNAPLSLGGQGLDFTGQFFAKNLTAYPDLRLTYAALGAAAPIVAVCADSQVQWGETCDDGNTTNGDGCNSTCQLEPLPPPNCNVNTAIDLGAPGARTTVAGNACLRIRNGYPSWWGVRDAGIQSISGDVPVPFYWASPCRSSSGEEGFGAMGQTKRIGPTSSACATTISLRGSASQHITLSYFGY